MGRKLSRLQKAGALVPMALLVGGWAVAVGNTGLASALSEGEPGIPEVPATALDQPAVVQSTGGVPGGALDPQAGLSGALETLSTNGIPSAALYAYHHAESVLADADPTCHLPWNLVAAVGRVESNHGRVDGNVLTADGLAQPGITKPEVGPMQLSTDTFDAVAIDADGDGQKNPQDIDDAATAAGIFLCSGTGDLSTDSGARAAVARYGSGADYVDSVMQISAGYANGQYSQTPDGFTTSPILTSAAEDMTKTPQERTEAKKHEEDTVKAREEAQKRRLARVQKRARGDNGGNKSSDGGSHNDGGGSNGDNGGGGGDGNGGGGGNKSLQDTVKNTTNTVNDTVKNTTDSVNDTVKKTTDGVKKLLGH